MAKGIRRSDGLPAATKRSPEVIDKILSILAIGLDQETACAAAGIRSHTWRKWLRNDADLKERAEEHQAKAIVATLGTIHEAGYKDWKAAAWKAEKLWPTKFGSRAVVDVNTKVQHDYTKLDLEEKRQLRALMLKSAMGEDEDEDE